MADTATAIAGKFSRGGMRDALRYTRRARAYAIKRQRLSDFNDYVKSGGFDLALKNLQDERTFQMANGRGKYNLSKNYSKFMGGKIGKALQSRVIGAISGTGMYTGRGLYTGRGDYVNNDKISAGGTAPEVPAFGGDSAGEIYVTRREYVSDIYGPTAQFNVQSYPINPGLEGTFPWLSQIAQNYDEYELLQCIFTYRSTTTDIGTTNGQCGTIVMATNYNAGAAPFTDKVIMMEYDGAMSSKTTESSMHGVECDPRKLSGSAGNYIRANPVLTNQDAKSYDHGLFQLAVCNCPSAFQNFSIGELWVSYTVKLRKPKFFVARGLGITRDVFVSGGNESITSPMGSSSTLLRGQQNNLGCVLGATVGNNGIMTALGATPNVFGIVFPASYSGTIRILVQAELATTTTGQLISTFPAFTGNITALADIYASSANGGDAPSTWTYATQLGAGGTSIALFHFKISPATTGINNTIQFTTAILTAAPTQMMIDISEYNAGFSYAAANLGSSEAPILVNPSGVVVVP